MSVKVSPDELAEHAEGYGPAAFVISTTAEGTAHVSHQPVTVVDGTVTCPAGKGTRAAVAERPSVVVLWPPTDDQTYSLIADGQATATDTGLSIAVTGAVLHRPAGAEVC